MGKIVFGIIAAVFIVGAANPILCADLKIGYVDTMKVFNEYQKTKDYDKVLQEKQKKKEEERDKKITELKKLQDQYVLLSDAEKENKKSEIEKMAQDLDEFRRQTVIDLRKQQSDYMAEIVEEIDKVVKKQAKDSKYDFVLNGQAVLHGESGFDITDSVLKELNGNYNKEKK